MVKAEEEEEEEEGIFTSRKNVRKLLIDNATKAEQYFYLAGKLNLPTIFAKYSDSEQKSVD